MKPTERRILQMVADGKITAAEGEHLLGALGQSRPSVWSMLTNPLEHLSSKTAWIVAILVIVAGTAFGLMGIRFDGALDVHVGSAPTAAQIAVDTAVAWPLVAVMLWLAARLIAGSGRLVDYLLAVGVARAPLLGSAIAALFMSEPPVLNERIQRGDLGWGNTALVVVSMLCLVWFLGLLLCGFRTVSNTQGARLVLGFIAALVVAEVVAKIIV